jgi:hypothetical protein
MALIKKPIDPIDPITADEYDLFFGGDKCKLPMTGETLFEMRKNSENTYSDGELSYLKQSYEDLTNNVRKLYETEMLKVSNAFVGQQLSDWKFSTVFKSIFRKFNRSSK